MGPNAGSEMYANVDRGQSCAFLRDQKGRGLRGEDEVITLLGYLLLSFFGLFLFSSITCSSQDKDLGVVNEPVGDRGGHSGGIEHIPPLSERQVCCQES